LAGHAVFDNRQVKTYSVEHNSRLRKYYQITSEGKEYMKVFLDEWQQVMKIYDFIKGGYGRE
jgi:PadR family transcriptional regulator PadR